MDGGAVRGTRQVTRSWVVGGPDLVIDMAMSIRGRQNEWASRPNRLERVEDLRGKSEGVG